MKVKSVVARSRVKPRKRVETAVGPRIIHGCGCMEQARSGWGREAILVCQEHQAVPR